MSFEARAEDTAGVLHRFQGHFCGPRVRGGQSGVLLELLLRPYVSICRIKRQAVRARPGPYAELQAS